MSIVMERGKGIGGTGYVRGLAYFPACELPAVVEKTASQSSSIGRNSDYSSEVGCGGEVDGGEAEVQSSYKGPLETMDALEDSLPIRRGISKFYCGKSKSFASLTDATSKLSSAKELGKPENQYSRKRKNLLAMSSRWGTPDSDASKRHANSSSRIAGITPTAAPVSSPTSSSTSNCSGEGRDQFTQLPPLHPFVRPLPQEIEGHSFPVRSFSLMDLQGMASLSSSSSSSSIGSEMP